MVVYEGEKDAVIAFISSKIPAGFSDTDIVINENPPSFKRAGLKVDSVIKLDKIATVLKDLIVGEIGELNEDLRKEVNQKLKKIMEI